MTPRQGDTEVATGKIEVRQRVWALLDERGAVQPPGAAGHIPSFVGADAAARRLADLPAWSSAHVVKANPDRAQLPVRVEALAAGKVVYMAVPRLETVEPFYLLDPERLDAGADLAEIATSQAAAESAPRVGTNQMPFIDMVVCGSVAVDRRGVPPGWTGRNSRRSSSPPCPCWASYASPLRLRRVHRTPEATPDSSIDLDGWR